jgi:HK97 family phage portal protein
MPAPTISSQLYNAARLARSRQTARNSDPTALATSHPPVPFVTRAGTDGSIWGHGTNMSGGLDSYTADAMLFSIVSGAAESCSQVEWHLYRKAPSGKEEERTEVKPSEHPAAKLWSQPNGFYSGMQFREAGGQHFELTGEWDMVVDFYGDLPVSMWPVRPDRLTPIKDHDRFLLGWEYRLGNEIIPLEPRQVLRVIRPDPSDPYRGQSPFFSTQSDVDTNRLAAAWSRNFFYNSAEPGGIIELDRQLSDTEWKLMRDRWADQHKGVSNAHRVALLELGKYVDRKYTIRDMQFTELRTFSSEQVRLAYRYPKPMTGAVENTNRANAEAAEVAYGRWFIKPRLNRVKEMLNGPFLRLFGEADVEQYEFDYDDPVPGDRALDSAELTATANAAQTYVGMGYDHEDVEKFLDIPAMKWEKPVPLVPVGPDGLPVQKPPPPPDGESTAPGRAAPAPKPPAPRREPGARIGLGPAWNADPRRVDPEQLPSLEESQAEYEDALNGLLGDWQEVEQEQQSDLLEQVGALVLGGAGVAGVAGLTVVTLGAITTLTAAMSALARRAVQLVITEAEQHGVTVPNVVPDPIRISALAEAWASTLARETAISAAGEATRVYRPGIGAGELEDHVKAYLDDLTDARPKLYLGAALSAAQNTGRTAAFMAGPTAAYYANETLDSNTCEPCKRVNGKWLGNTILGDVLKTYPTGGYIDCEGRLRCRGTVSAVWRPEKTGDR